MFSSMSMADFQKKLLDLEKQINNNSEDFDKRLVDLEGTVARHSNDIKKLQDRTNRIERQIWLNHSEATENHSQAMQKMTELCDKISQTQRPIFPNMEHNQHNNSTDSGNSEEHHEKTDSPHHHEDSNADSQNKQLWNAFSNQSPFLVPQLEYHRQEKIELPKFDGNEKIALHGLIKRKNILRFMTLLVMTKKLSTLP